MTTNVLKQARYKKGHSIRVQGFRFRLKESAVKFGVRNLWCEFGHEGVGFGVQRVRLQVYVIGLRFKGLD